MKKVIPVYGFIFALLVSLFSGNVFAQDQAAAPEQAQTPPAQAQGIKPYEGEITDEMVVSFIRADAKIRQLRQQIGAMTQQILGSENLAPEVYVAIIQKAQTDQALLQKLREKAAEIAASEKAAADAAAQAAAPAPENQ